MGMSQKTEKAQIRQVYQFFTKYKNSFKTFPQNVDFFIPIAKQVGYSGLLRWDQSLEVFRFHILQINLAFERHF
jgi:hypothetical protein